MVWHVRPKEPRNLTGTRIFEASNGSHGMASSVASAVRGRRTVVMGVELMKYLISSFPLRAHGLGLLELVCSHTCMAESSKMFRAFLHISDTYSHFCQNPGTARDVEAAVHSVVGEVR